MSIMNGGVRGTTFALSPARGWPVFPRARHRRCVQRPRTCRRWLSCADSLTVGQVTGLGFLRFTGGHTSYLPLFLRPPAPRPERRPPMPPAPRRINRGMSHKIFSKSERKKTHDPN